MAMANSTVASPRLNIDIEVAAMQQMTVDQLRGRFAEVFGEATNSRHKEWLIKRIAWRMQANAEGGLSERAMARAKELARDADLRVTAPRKPRMTADAEARTKTVAAKFEVSHELLPGTMLQRPYKGRTIRVVVLDDGFECEGERHKSLTAVVKKITGKHWNGFHFFGLREKAGAK